MAGENIVKRPKLSIDQQIFDMQSKGISFVHSDIEGAKHFLKYNNYYLNHFVGRFDTVKQTIVMGSGIA